MEWGAIQAMIMDKCLRVHMPDGSIWDVPVEVVAYDRAKHFAHEYSGDINLSLKEDTILLFELDEYEIIDWASNNMNWSDVKMYARPSKDPDPVSLEEGWRNGEKEIA